MSIQDIYLDYQASTPVDPRVKNAMEPYSEQLFANPHVHSYTQGIEAGNAVNNARRQVAFAINADATSIIFTSGATEANNLAILGVARAASGDRKKIITIASEHKSVLEPAKALKKEGFDIKVLPVKKSGLVDLEKLESIVDKTTLLVSVMHVNNETGIIQPVLEIARICHAFGVLFHTDCAQSLGKVPLDIEAIGADLATLSSHKAYGPKGVGALYIRKKSKVKIQPILYGGGQERGIRSGTLPVPLCVGFGAACEIAANDIKKDMQRIGKLTDLLIEGIQRAHPKARLNGSAQDRAPGSFSMCLMGGMGDEYLQVFQGLQISTGSACTSVDAEPSSVLKAYGLSKADADASLRFGVGRFTTEDDIRCAIDIISKGIKQLRLGGNHE